jgi:cytochrome c2
MDKRMVFFMLLASLILGCRNNSRNERIDEVSAGKGQILFLNMGCATCHSLSGEKKYGPVLNDIYDRDIEVVRRGKTVTVKVDREYIIRSIQNPGYEKVTTFQGQTMPVPNMSDEDIRCIAEYIVWINTQKQTESPKIIEPE